ncbi:hypothetical protein BDB00DRAFT_459884 [Zychaea mexicana]|uniref:uncharacterized protein n=1 Tax=Zychaea mexicana TaxID=64656 RepID=UPI0022FE53FA|nr:uncharacterized protein BDB00DRAFT_459884 [Zychaea mexicana]KAI9492066.1 hypothetical protein BDB00DRAFT_459884 [Zychaea mexicana]
MLLSQELVVVAIQGNYERVFAHYDGFREKTPLELYQNACMRMHVPVRRSVELALENNNDKSGDEQLVLADACLVSRDIPVICDLLRHIKPVTKLDLSGNVLYDHDIADVFRHIQDLHHVDLSSNRLTSQTIARFVRYPSLRSLSISFNPLGCDTLGLLPELLNQCPQLASLDLESCDIRNYTLPDPTRHAYQHLGHRLDHLNLSYNPSSDDSASLEQWKSLVQNLVKDNGSNGQQILNCK